MDACRVELRLRDSSMICLDRTAVENGAADDRFRRSEPDVSSTTTRRLRQTSF